MSEFVFTLTDPDRQIGFHLQVEARVRKAQRARSGWRDGGDPGAPGEVELVRVWCLGISVWLGPQVVESCLADEHLQRQIGEWCRQDRGAEIQEQVWYVSGCE